MALKYIHFAIFVVAFVAPSVFTGREKMEKMRNCLTEEYIKTKMESKDATIAACKAEMVDAPPTEAPEEGKRRRPNMCFVECIWRQSGLTKDGSFSFEDYAKASMKPEFQETAVTTFHNCLTDEGLPTAYTINKEDHCQSLKKYGHCWFKAMTVCNAD